MTRLTAPAGIEPATHGLGNRIYSVNHRKALRKPIGASHGFISVTRSPSIYDDIIVHDSRDFRKYRRYPILTFIPFSTGLLGRACSRFSEFINPVNTNLIADNIDTRSKLNKRKRATRPRWIGRSLRLLRNIYVEAFALQFRCHFIGVRFD